MSLKHTRQYELTYLDNRRHEIGPMKSPTPEVERSSQSHVYHQDYIGS